MRPAFTLHQHVERRSVEVQPIREHVSDQPDVPDLVERVAFQQNEIRPRTFRDRPELAFPPKHLGSAEGVRQEMGVERTFRRLCLGTSHPDPARREAPAVGPRSPA